MVEEKRSIKNYEEIYEMTRSGKIIAKRNGREKVKKGDPYGYKHVHLCKEGERKLYNTFELWKSTFKDASESEFKGTK
ncbi:3-ketosteroid-delta-1-dehydrogenase [Bacillus cereus]|uniref:3-ketosteroid-delta-1-dehydrogenase n=1 Tax=Bacillus paramycoides TaxID=2026194 RepID=UPI000BF32EB5|nr:3-ketosteroid-delta-1-dehydrogenase [Bacillus paramycoides]MED0962178.1 3-ketosteroid-delta-1-dehydrogenase [Bacillus paramycoides]PFM54117.1 3-ketosteroid-delta-1-dehydrogenase [Bacillus cereus]PGP75457.1 3-ketosteroid-delta-1-dehydrogenase [Bacillus cereus]